MFDYFIINWPGIGPIHVNHSPRSIFSAVEANYFACNGYKMN